MYVDPGINTSASNLKWVLPYCKPDLPRVVGALLWTTQQDHRDGCEGGDADGEGDLLRDMDTCAENAPG